jgi:N6-L-threonylcarbamoyladenine synthase
MTILGIETSCDETGAAVLKRKGNHIKLLSNIISSSLDLHKKTGGIIPEYAASEQVKYMIPVIDKALKHAGIDLSMVDAIALTYGPGLIGSLLVGVETAKTISYAYDKPIIPVNHMVGHIYANFIDVDSKPKIEIQFPAIALVVSGGHTDLLLMKDHGELILLGGTRDDAAGEAFDKIGRLLGLSYPAGPEIESLAKRGNPNRFRFPRPLIGSDDFDFSFSGLKTAVLREVQAMKQLSNETISDLAYATQDAIIDVLVKKTLKAVEKYSTKSILLSGGVAANQKLRDTFEQKAKSQQLNAKIFVPQKSLCTDNAAMIAAAAFYNYSPASWGKITADPELYFD